MAEPQVLIDVAQYLEMKKLQRDWASLVEKLNAITAKIDAIETAVEEILDGDTVEEVKTRANEILSQDDYEETFGN